MEKNLLVWGLLPVLFAVAGCGQSERRPSPVAKPVAPAPTSTTVTLSTEQLMALDWNGRAVERSMILDKRVVGTGVELDIRFPGNTKALCSVDHTSSGAAGKRTLVGLDVGPYEAFALKFSLISVNARCDPNVPVEIAAGALIGPAGDGRYYACEPAVLGLAADRAAAIATTPMQTEMIRLIGIHVHAVNPQAWDPNGAILTVRVEPAPDAEVLPVPTVTAEDTTVRRAAGTSERKAREKTPSTPRFGTKRIGAW
ncbi:MAG: hypothetical protein ABFD90_20520 [Phycisphaerales bacterium]